MHLPPLTVADGDKRWQVKRIIGKICTSKSRQKDFPTIIRLKSRTQAVWGTMLSWRRPLLISFLGAIYYLVQLFHLLVQIQNDLNILSVQWLFWVWINVSDVGSRTTSRKLVRSTFVDVFVWGKNAKNSWMAAAKYVLDYVFIFFIL